MAFRFFPCSYAPCFRLFALHTYEGYDVACVPFAPGVYVYDVCVCVYAGSSATVCFALRVCLKSPMLYIFLISDTNHVKFGYTNGCPWARVRDGLWRLVHPEACCGKLGWEDLQLVALAPGTIVDENAIQLQQPSVSGEFWHERDLEGLRSAIEARVGALLPLPPKPDAPQMGRGIEKRPCCGGTQVVCFACHATFAGYVNLGTHRREGCPMALGVADRRAVRVVST